MIALNQISKQIGHKAHTTLAIMLPLHLCAKILALAAEDCPKPALQTILMCAKRECKDDFDFYIQAYRLKRMLDSVTSNQRIFIDASFIDKSIMHNTYYFGNLKVFHDTNMHQIRIDGIDNYSVMRLVAYLSVYHGGVELSVDPCLLKEVLEVIALTTNLSATSS